MANLVTKILITARDEASAVFGSLQAKVAGVAAAIAGFFGVSLFRASVDSAREFESAMSAVAAVAEASADELAALEAAAKAAGISTQYSSVEAAGALGELAKAGLSATDAVAALPAVLDLATAGQVDLATAAGYVSQAVAGMGLSFDDAGRVADVLAMGANASLTSVEGLAQALSYAAPAANTLGMSLEETVAIIGKFADADIDASRAGTALNSILAQFQDPASKFRKALRDAGITSTDFSTALRGIAAAGPRAEAAILAVGTEAGPALRGLLNQGIGALDELENKLQNSSGSARKFADVVAKNLEGAQKALASVWKAVKEDIGTPVLETLARQITAVTERLRGFVADGTAKAFGEAIKEAFEAGGKWAADFFGRIDFSRLAANMRQYAADLQSTLTDIGNRATTAGNVLSTAWAVMGTGIAAVRTAIYSLGAGMSWLVSAFLADLAKITDGLAKITFGDLSAGFSSAAERMREEARATYAVYEALREKSGEAFAGIVEGAEDVSAAWDRLSDSAADAVPAVEHVAATARNAAADTDLLGQTFIGLGTSLADLGVSSQQVAARLAEISAQTGVTVTSSRELHDAVTEGAIAFDAATGAWSKGADQLIDINAALEAADAALLGFKKGLVDSAAGAKTLSDQSGDTAAKIRALTEQYKAFIAAGDTQGAAGVLVQIEALKKLGDQAGETAVDLQQVAMAFETLGVKSQAELNRAADFAKEAFGTIRDSGTASAAEIEKAFEVLVTAAVAGSEDLVQTMKGVEGSSDALGRALEKAIKSAGSGAEIDQLVAKLYGLEAAGKLSASAANDLAGQIEAALDRIEDMTPGIQSVEEAFRSLGVKSPAELKRVADAAKESYDVIKAAGREAREQLPEAFEVYAIAAIAANGGVATSMLKAQAASFGLRVETGKTGKDIVRAMGEAAETTKQVEDGVASLADAWDEAGNIVSTVAGGASDDIRRVSGATQEWTGSLRSGIQTGESWARLLEARMAAVEASANNVAAAMARLDRQQAELNSSGARGVEDLKLRLIELNGTEEEIARARHERDEANVRRQIALLEIEIKRAAARGDETNTLREEIKLLNEQLKLLDQVYKAEQRNTKNPDRPRGSGGSGGSGGISAGGGAPTGGTTTPSITTARTPVINLNVDARGGLSLKDREDVERLARVLIPKMNELARRGF